MEAQIALTDFLGAIPNLSRRFLVMQLPASNLLVFALVICLALLIILAVLLMISRKRRLSAALTSEARVQSLQEECSKEKQISLESNDLLQRLHQIDHDLAEIPDAAGQLQFCLSEFNSMLGVPLSEVYQLEEEDDLSLLSAVGELSSSHSPILESLARDKTLNTMLHTKEAVIDQIFHPDLEPEGAHLLWSAFPLFVNDQLEGALLYLRDANPAASNLAAVDFFCRRLENTLCLALLQHELATRDTCEERQQQALELQDSVTQVLYSISLGAKSASTAADRMPERLPGLLDYIGNLARTGQLELQTMRYELQPEILADYGLIEAISKQSELLNSHQDIKVYLSLSEEPALPIATKAAIYRVVQEAVRNIIAHAQATEVQITFKEADGCYILLIRDDGLGFDPDDPVEDATGIKTMQTQVAASGGSFKLLSHLNEGTEIRAIFPIDA